MIKGADRESIGLCRESIERKHKVAIERKLKNLDGSRICRESIGQTESSETFLDGSKSYRGSIEITRRRLDRKDNCQGCVELEEKRFFKKGKTHRDKCNKQATQTKIQSTC